MRRASCCALLAVWSWSCAGPGDTCSDDDACSQTDDDCDDDSGDDDSGDDDSGGGTALLREGRGVWLHPVWGTDPETAIPDITSDVQRLVGLGHNLLFPLVENDAAYYGSAVTPVEEGWDAFDYPRTFIDAVGDASPDGRVQTHLWTCVFHMNALLDEHPEWVAVRRDGTPDASFVCPARPEVRAHALEVIEELMDRYPEAGIHLDYIRYADRDTCYCDHCRASFAALHGVDPLDLDATDERWVEWRAEQVTEMVRSVREAADARHPRRLVSAAVFNMRSPEEDRVERGQHWLQWMEDDLLDFVVPMNYTSNHAEFVDRTVTALNTAGGAGHVYVGIGLYLFEEDTEQAAVQMELARALGAEGTVLFRASYIDEPLEDRLADLYREPAVAPHADDGHTAAARPSPGQRDKGPTDGPR